MNEIVSTITSAITGFTSAIPLAVKDAFSNLLYEDASAASPTLSAFAKFGLVAIGIGIVTGICYIGVNLLRRKI